MNILDLIGNFVLSLYGAFLLFAKEAIEVVDSLINTGKKKVLNLLKKRYPKQNTYHSENGTTTQTQIKSSSAKPTQTVASELFSRTHPLPGQDLLVKEGWTKVAVHPVPQTGQQVIVLKDEKNSKGKMLGKEAFLEYLKELNEKHNR